MVWDLEKEAQESTSIPWASAAALMVELRSTYEIPPEPVLTKAAAAGMFKLSHIAKTAQTPEQMQMEAQKAAMTDPNVVAALDHQQMMAEREALVTQVQALQAENEMAQQQAMMSNQQAQVAQQQAEQTGMILQQAQAEREQAMQQAVQARDSAMAKEVDMLQHREQLMQQADQLAMQLKQMAATTPAQQMAQQQQAVQEQQAMQEQAVAAEQGGEQAPPAKQKTKKQQDEAAQAQQEAQVQSAQAEQATAEEQTEQEQAAMMQQQMMGGMPPEGMAPPMAAPPQPGMAPQPGMEAMPKQSSLRVQHIAQLFREKRAAAMSKCSGKAKTAQEIRNILIEKRASVLRAVGERAAYGAGGAAIGAGLEGAKAYSHKRRYGDKAKTTATKKELDIHGRLMAAGVEAKRNPSYRNKLRLANLKYKARIERAGRENPGGAITRGAIRGAIGGVAVGPAAGRLVKKLRGISAGKQELEAAQAAAKQVAAKAAK